MKTFILHLSCLYAFWLPLYFFYFCFEVDDYHISNDLGDSPVKRILAFVNRTMSKRKEVVDLTYDEDEPTVKRTRCGTPQPGCAAADQKYGAQSASVLDLTEEDERLAWELQAQYDQESLDGPLRQSESKEDDDLKCDISLIHTYVQGMKKTACITCRKQLLKEEKDLPLVFKQWFAETEQGQNAFKQFFSGDSLKSSLIEISSATTCQRKLCFATTCMGCGRKCSTKTSKTEATGVREMTWCCDRGRLFLVWALLCGYDRRQTNLGLRTTTKSSKAKASSNSGQAHGIGYGGNCTSRKNRGAKVQVDPDDSVTEQTMSCLTALLPSLTCENLTSFDLEPPAVLLSILLQSKLLHKAAELLRDDSLENATQRLSLYQAALDLVEKLGSHPNTACTTIHNERPELAQGADLLQLSFSTEDPANGQNKARETTQSLATCLASFDRQSKLMLDHSKTDPDSFTTKDSQDMLSLCHRVSDLADFLLANSDRSSVTNNAHQSSATMTKDSWHGALAILELPDNDILSSHHYADEARKIDNPPLGRMKTLSLELARLTTGLPPGIFVRHCSTRLDVMKVLIIGPQGTPYENGLFEFDLLCGKNFPNEPPKMRFKTTGGGQIGFNPNLYNNGKVCLSLLGTWSGEPWQPGSSTILQVLLSIQAMIFCEEPWCNEPGRENSAGSQQSKDYNRTVQGWTVQHAMAEWLKQVGDEGIWSDIVVQHFQTSGSEIFAKAEEWRVSSTAMEQLKAGLGQVGVAAGESA